MRKSIIIALATAGLAACGQSSDESSTNAAVKAAAPEKPRPAYCFFKKTETKAWAAKVDKSGNVIVSGKAYREDSRYKALLSPATVSGTTAEVAPTITVNDTGYAAPDNWWSVSETIPSSNTVTEVTVRCGEETLATLTVPRKK
ncbi:MAG TPA: hypothetical protein VLM36_03365 [Sphingomicrobium sp.]|nr:hypothetical protein [Sphingomicrobium sp.]